MPNAALSEKRKNDQGDFYACRKCNSRKSHIDYLLGVVTKSQSRNSEFATETLIRALDRNDRSSNRFIDMTISATQVREEFHMDIPIFGQELLEYIQFLGKGLYFKKFRLIFQPRSQVMLLDYANKQVHAALEASYESEHGTNPYRDLELNARSEVIADGECIIWSKNSNFLMIFHDYTSVTVQIKKRNRKTTELENRKNMYILETFSDGRAV